MQDASLIPETPILPAARSPLSAKVLLVMVLGRTVSNMPIRLLSPFLPTIARYFGVSLVTAGTLASVMGGMGVLAIATGRLSDTIGRRIMLQVSLFIMAVLAATAALTTEFNMAIAAFAGFGLAKALYDPTLLAYVGDVVPYAQRGRTVAITEIAWSAAWFFGVPIGGLLVERSGLAALWWFIAIAAVLAGIATRFVLPKSNRVASTNESVARLSLREIFRNPQTWALAVVSFGMLFGLDNIFILYGAILEDRFGLTLGTLGLLSIVISVAELVAELGSAGLTDKIGKKRSAMGGLLLFAGLVLLLPIVSTTAWLTVLAFAVVIMVFEYTVVSFLPLVSEISPTARATMVGLYIGSFGVGRIVAPLVGTRLYAATGSLTWSAILSAIAALIAALVLWWGIPER